MVPPDDPERPDEPARRVRAALWVLLAAWLLAVAWVTLRPAPAPSDVLDVVARVTAWLTTHGIPLSYDVVEAGANVVMFVPLGVLGTLLARPRRTTAAGAVLRAAAWGFALSGAIELTQLLWLPSRFATAQDVLLNTAGAALGALAVTLPLRAVDPAPRRPHL